MTSCLLSPTLFIGYIQKKLKTMKEKFKHISEVKVQEERMDMCFIVDIVIMAESEKQLSYQC